MAAKKKRAGMVRKPRPKVESVRNIGMLLSVPKSNLTPEEVDLTERIAKEIAVVASNWKCVATGPCTITQVKNESPTPTYRRISLIGGEEMHICGAYMGVRDGLIFRFTPDTVLLGLNSAEMAITHLEMPIRASGLLKDKDSSMTLLEMIERQIDMKVMPDEAMEKIKTEKERAERERLIKEAEAKSVNYGSNWGAY